MKQGGPVFYVHPSSQTITLREFAGDNLVGEKLGIWTMAEFDKLTHCVIHDILRHNITVSTKQMGLIFND